MFGTQRGQGGGGLQYEKDRGAQWKFWNEPLRDMKILFCGRYLEFFHP